jgi:hypothetical protein
MREKEMKMIDPLQDKRDAIVVLKNERERLRTGWLHIGEPLIAIPSHKIIVGDAGGQPLSIRCDDFIWMVERFLGVLDGQVTTVMMPTIYPKQPRE